MRHRHLHQFDAGFTIIEIILTVTVLALIAGIGTPVYLSFQNRNTLDLAATAYASSVRRAQAQARAMAGDSTWGVRVQSGSISVFKGGSYSGRDANYDEDFTIPTSIVISGQQEVVFAKFSGLPQTTGSLTLVSNNNESRVLSINAKGTVQY